jgi:linoleoyl-CoA desaturase
MHHTYTNVLGKDRDVGYEILRINDAQPWQPAYVFQPFYAGLLALLFQWGVAMHDIDLGALRRGETKLADVGALFRGIAKKASKQLIKAANAVANLMRNLWTFTIIFCGHFPDGSVVFSEADLVGETRGGWYRRQILGSCNIEGGRLFHVMSGNLSFQIEHHLFPDLPSNRYAEAAPRVRALCERYGIPYNSGSLTRQFGGTVRTILRLALPGTKAMAHA